MRSWGDAELGVQDDGNGVDEWRRGREQTAMGSAHPLGAQVGVGFETAVQELRDENQALLAEIERLGDAICEQKVHVANGYVVLTWPAANGGFLARCPALHAVAKRATEEDTLEDVTAAMQAVLEAYETMGKTPPPRDVTA